MSLTPEVVPSVDCHLGQLVMLNHSRVLMNILDGLGHEIDHLDMIMVICIIN